MSGVAVVLRVSTVLPLVGARGRRTGGPMHGVRIMRMLTLRAAVAGAVRFVRGMIVRWCHGGSISLRSPFLHRLQDRSVVPHSTLGNAHLTFLP